MVKHGLVLAIMAIVVPQGCRAPLDLRLKQDLKRRALLLIDAAYPGLREPKAVEFDREHATGPNQNLVLVRYGSDHGFEASLADSLSGHHEVNVSPSFYQGRPTGVRPQAVAEKIAKVLYKGPVLIRSVRAQTASKRASSQLRIYPYREGIPCRKGEGSLLEFDSKTGNLKYLGGSSNTFHPEGQDLLRPSDLAEAYANAVAEAKRRHEDDVARYRGKPNYQRILRDHWTYGKFGSTAARLAARCWSIDYFASPTPLPGLRRAWMVKSSAGMAVLDSETGKLLDFTALDDQLLPDLKKSPYIDVHKEAAKKG
jgi:hypothetical protein